MNINSAELILDFIKILRSERLPEVIDSVMGIPVSALRWLSQKLDIESAIVYFYPTNGRKAIKTNIYHASAKWGELKDELTNLSDSKILSEIICRPRGKNQSTDPIGYLGFYRSSGFDKEERSILKDVSQFFGDYMYDILYLFRMQHQKNAIDKIEQVYSSKDKPGTIIKYTQGIITRATRASASYFAVFIRDKIVIEYFQKPSWNRPSFIDEHPSYKISETFSRLCNSSNYFQWVDLSDVSPLGKFLNKYVSVENNNDWEYLISVVKNNNIPIALWIFQYSKQQLVFYDIDRDLINYVSKKTIQEAGLLFQRRTEQMIIEPVFKYRNTEIDEKLTFIIMPFSEQWSDRIWERILKPIIINEGLKPLRGDDLYGRDIMEDIWKGLISAKLIIADITGRNPNVFYELGIAHTLGKNVILLTQNVKDIPFDLNRYRHIVYEDNLDGYEKLEKQLKASIRESFR